MNRYSALVADVTAATDAAFTTLFSAVVVPETDTVLVVADVSAASATASSTLQLLIGSTAYPMGIVAAATTRTISRTVRQQVPVGTALTVAIQYKVTASGAFSCEPVTGAPTNNWAALTIRDVR